MRFDDRLATVLAQPVAGSHDRNVRWRQLVDLVARSNGKADEALLDQALKIIGDDRSSVPEALRAAAVRAIAGSPVPAALLEQFASDTLAVAAPLFAGAQLEGKTLGRIRASSSEEVKRFLATLYPTDSAEAEHAPPPARASRPTKQKPASAPAAPPAEEQDRGPSISDVLARLDRLRAERERSLQSTDPVAHDGEGPSIFRWECSASGEIDWVEGVPRGPLIGKSIAVADADEGVDDCVERAFSIRAPFRDCLLELGEEGLAAGRWSISGAPAFAPGDGRFIGYRGIAQRGTPAEFSPAAPAPGAPAEGHDALREMIHEIKTPLNAIIGFAEIIDGQYFGPAHRRYRERAAQIVTNARALLEAANDLDFVARMQSARIAGGTAALDQLFPRFADRLIEIAAAQGVLVDVETLDGIQPFSLDPALGERLLNRFSEAVLSAASPGEHLVLHVNLIDQRCAISLTRPRSTILATREDLLDPEFTLGEADRGLLGLGFSLRLVNGLADLAGGSLEIEENYFTIFLPPSQG